MTAGQLLGLTEFIPPYLAPNTTGAMILNGVNYASGAGGILDSSGYILVRFQTGNFFWRRRFRSYSVLSDISGASKVLGREYLEINWHVPQMGYRSSNEQK